MFIGALTGAAANAAVRWRRAGRGDRAPLRDRRGAGHRLSAGDEDRGGLVSRRRGRARPADWRLTLGKAFPTATALFGVEWREPMLLASGLAIIGERPRTSIVARRSVRGGDGRRSQATPRMPSTAAIAVGDRTGAMAHMWEPSRCGRGSRVRDGQPRHQQRQRAIAEARRRRIDRGVSGDRQRRAGCGLAGYIADRIGQGARRECGPWGAARACAALTWWSTGARRGSSTRCRC